MRTVDEILAAVTTLSPAEFTKLRTEIERRDRLARTIVLDTSRGLTFHLRRLDDGENWNCHRQSLAIEEDYGFYLQFFLALEHRRELNFAHVYLTLKNMSGESSRYLDEYKQGFSFPFALDVIRGNHSYAYLLDVHNIRDSLYFSFRKVVEVNDPRLKTRVIQQPFEDEFGKEDMRYFRCYFYGYLEGRWKTLEQLPERLEPFVRQVPAAAIVFGYCNGKAFEEQHNSSEKCSEAYQRYQELITTPRESSQVNPHIVKEGEQCET